MIGHGLRVLRLSNEEILNNTEKVLDQIAGFLPFPSGRGVGERACSLTLRTLNALRQDVFSPLLLGEGLGVRGGSASRE